MEELDLYRFAGKAGEVLSAEFNGYDIYPWDEHDITTLVSSSPWISGRASPRRTLPPFPKLA